MAPKSRRFRTKVKKPRKLIPYIAPKPQKPKLWVKGGKGIQVLKYRPNLQETKISYFSSNKLKAPTSCIIAPILAKIAQPKDWNSLHLQQIFEIADEVYRTTIVALKLKTNSKYPLQCVHPKFYVNDFHITIFVGSNYPTGNLENLKDYHQDNVVHNSMLKILDENDGLVVQCGDKVLALWSGDEDGFYCYSPYGWDNFQGLPALAKAKEVKTLLENMLQFTFGFYNFFSVKILHKTKIHHSLTEVWKDAARMDAGADIAEAEGKGEAEPGPSYESPKETAKDKKAKKDLKKTTSEKSLPIIPVEKVETLETLPFSGDYRKIGDTRGILVGSSYVKDPERLLHTNIAAATFLYHIPSYIWTSETIMDILKLGKKIFEDSDEVADSEDWSERVALPIKFGRKLLNIQYEKVVFGEVTTLGANVLTLDQGMRKFFEFYDMGLILGPQNVLIWQERGLFVLFDPKERDGKGRKWTKEYSKALGDTKSSGNACVTWYVSVSHLAEAYILNTSIKHRYDPYRIVKMNIYEIKAKSEDWEEWKAFGTDKWIIQGTKNLCSFVSSEADDMSSKALTTAVAALVHTVIKPEEDWESPDVDGLYTYGVELFNQSQEGRKDLEMAEGVALKLKDVKQRYTIDSNRVELLIEECAVTGMIKSEGKAKSKGPKLSMGIKSFFERYKTGVLTVRNLALAVWKNKGHYYMFYPYEKNAGRSDNCICANDSPFGQGYVLRFRNLPDMYSEFMNITSFHETEEYCLNNLYIEVSPASNRPPLYNYSEFGENAAILRPYKELHEGHEMFEFRADRQTLPNLLTSLCFGEINHPAKWTKEDMGDILRIGDRIFCKLVTVQPECQSGDYEAQFDQIMPVIGMNKFTFTKDTIEGRMVIVPPDMGEEGEMECSEGMEDEMIEEEDEEAEMLDSHVPTGDARGALINWEKSVTNKGTAILEAPTFKVAIWKKDERLYVFDPKASGENGELTERRLEKAKDKAMPGWTSNFNMADYSQLANEGSAYVAWFTNVDEFIDHILNKVTDDNRHGNFALHNLHITNQPLQMADMDFPPKVGFRAVNPNHAIIRGTLSQNDFMFVNRNKQDASNSVVALAFALISSPAKWTQTLLDVILKYGDRLHSKSVKDIKDSSTPERACVDKLPLADIIRTFRIYKIKFDFDIAAKASGLISIADLKKQLGKLGNMEAGSGAVIAMKGYLNAIWKSEGYLYLFDPYENNPIGMMSDSGFASLSRFKKADTLAEFLVEKFACLPGQNYYEWAVIDIKHLLPPSLSPSPPIFNDFEKLKFVGLLPKNQEMFVEFGNGLKILKHHLPDNRIPENIACLAAIVHSRLHYVELWNFNIFERVYFLARYLYNKTECEIQTYHKMKCVQFEEITPNFSIDNNMLCHLEVQKVMQGAVTISQKADGISVSLSNALKLFFRECKHAVLIVNGKYYALWTEGEKFYLFRIEEGENEAHCISGSGMEAMYEIMTKIPNEKINYYEMWNIKVVLVPVKDAICNPVKTYEGKEEEIMHAREERVSEFSKKSQYYDYLGKHVEKKKDLRRTQFVPMVDGIEILTSNVCLEQHMFFGTEDYFPCLKAACIVAAGMAHIRSPSLWNRKTLTQIVESGVNLYVSSMAVRRIKNFEIINLERVFYLSNIRVEVSAFAPAMQTANKQNLLTVLTFILRKHKIAYLMNDTFCFTIILEENACYLYFPGSVDNICEDFCNTKSCLVKFCTLWDLIEKIVEQIIKTQTVLIGPITVFVK